MNDYEFHEFVAERLGEIAKPPITKRELIAAMAMQGLASVPISGGVTDAAIAHDVGAEVAYADALIAALAGKGGV